MKTGRRDDNGHGQKPSNNYNRHGHDTFQWRLLHCRRPSEESDDSDLGLGGGGGKATQRTNLLGDFVA
jgi:hypothetical protein